MTPVIKASAANAFSPFAAVTAGPPIASAPPIEVDPRIEAFGIEIERLKERIDRMSREAERRVNEAHAEGARGVRIDDARRLAALEAGIAAAHSMWDDRLATLEGLAALLARRSLAKMFEETVDLAEITTRAIDRYVRHMRREMLVRVRVSMSDFPDGSALEAMATRLGLDSAAIRADTELTSGACRIDLKTGQVDVGVTEQMHIIDRTLAHMTIDGEGA